ncbi:hypothetical protein A7D00_4206 [Trichophyton violaceum]|uniref:Uncharacterized protein n=1 Tax=Trichophyton violaceum TaxID=34388 RepID=A0A178FHA7_TRIVO|nr:hypothetical protein A7D00_4206 [Trichophyton violaceum]
MEKHSSGMRRFTTRIIDVVGLTSLSSLQLQQSPAFGTLYTLNGRELHEPVMEILVKFNVDYNPYAGLYPVQRASDEDMKQEWYSTIFVSATKRSLDRSWYLTCKEIRKLLEEKNMAHFDVEIIDCRASVHPRAFPLDPKDPFVEQWPSLEDAIIDMLGDRTRDWELPTAFGRSIGLRDSNAYSGTFGGYVELHPGGIQQNPILVDQPSLKYHEQSIDEYIFSIKEMDTYISPEVKERIWSGDPLVPTGKVRGYELNQQIINPTNALVDQGVRFFKEKNHHLGKSWWLFYAANSSQIPQNSDSGHPQRVKNTYMPEETYISGNAIIEEGMQAFKLGNCTGFTKVASLKHWMKNEGEWMSIMGQAYSVAPRSGPAFGNAGDSGSLVISCDGKLVGLYLGGDRDIGWGLFIG